MVTALLISIAIVLAIMVLFAKTTSPSRRARQQRWREDQMASGKPFQMGSDPMTVKHKKYFF
jgi:hypothetical protein